MRYTAGKKIFTILAGIMFVFLVFINRYSIGEIAVPVNINIELKKEFADLINIRTLPDNKVYKLTPTTPFNPNLKTVVIHTKIHNNRPLKGLDLLVSKSETAFAISDAIDYVAIFIGNEPFYLPAPYLENHTTQNLQGDRIYTISNDLVYKNSIIGRWINWRGDLNFILKAIISPVMFFWLYLPLYILFAAFFSIHKDVFKNINPAYYFKKYEYIFFGLIVLIGFLLRYNGYLRFSVEGDELASAEYAKPDLPFLNTFSDPGNPPFYYILLRILYSIFGWKETTGRMLSVVIGTFLIAAVFLFTKRFAGRRSAIFASLFIATSKLMITISNNTRSYILVMLLDTLLAFVLLKILFEDDKKNTGLLAIYTLLGIFLVNTHFYGILCVSSNFIIYLFYRFYKKEFQVKSFVSFLICNIIIAISFLPYFIKTAFDASLMNKNFNKWIPELNIVQFSTIMALLIMFIILYLIIKKIIKTNIYYKTTYDALLNYCVLLFFLVSSQALVISIIKPIFTLRYLSICLPFVFIGLSIVLNLQFLNRFISILCYSMAMLFIPFFYHTTPPITVADVPKEANFFITSDALAHKNIKSAVLERSDNHAGFYGYNDIQTYNGKFPVEVLYISPLGATEAQLSEPINRYNLDKNDILRIIINDSKVILKKYF
jgi:hypothetical protein